jgi:cyanophycinase
MRATVARLSARLPLAALLVLCGATYAAPRASGQRGPENGSLVIVGGALDDADILRTFLDLAGGPAAHVVVIPTAGELSQYDEWSAGLEPFKSLGARNLTVLHTRDPEVANTEAFVRPLTSAKGVWLSGGRQFRLAEAYLGTRTEAEIRGVLERGGVVGGSSAGASMLGSYLVRGDTRSNEILMGDHERGFGLLEGTAIDQHLLARNRQFDLIEVVTARPELLGIGIDENTAVVVRGQGFEVIGRGHVAIYDPGAMLDNGGLFYFLSPGDRFDLSTRQGFRPGQSSAPFGRVERRPWPGG